MAVIKRYRTVNFYRWKYMYSTIVYQHIWRCFALNWRRLHRCVDSWIYDLTSKYSQNIPFSHIIFALVRHIGWYVSGLIGLRSAILSQISGHAQTRSLSLNFADMLETDVVDCFDRYVTINQRVLISGWDPLWPIGTGTRYDVWWRSRSKFYFERPAITIDNSC